jgi:hypothetical protein
VQKRESKNKGVVHMTWTQDFSVRDVTEFRQGDEFIRIEPYEDCEHKDGNCDCTEIWCGNKNGDCDSIGCFNTYKQALREAKSFMKENPRGIWSLSGPEEKKKDEKVKVQFS